MKVKEAKEHLDYLKNLYDTAIKIQEYCLHNSESQEIIKSLEESSGINMSLRSFVSSVACVIADERSRISRIIDDAEIKID